MALESHRGTKREEVKTAVPEVDTRLAKETRRICHGDESLAKMTTARRVSEALPKSERCLTSQSANVIFIFQKIDNQGKHLFHQPCTTELAADAQANAEGFDETRRNVCTTEPKTPTAIDFLRARSKDVGQLRNEAGRGGLDDVPSKMLAAPKKSSTTKGVSEKNCGFSGMTSQQMTFF